MSVHFAIPATTFVLKAIIEKRLKAAYGVFTPPQVSIEPPPRPATPAPNTPVSEPAGVMLFMHHAAANAAWRNMHDPHVNGAGNRVANAPLVLDLHYLVAAQGSDLEREVLLGVAMSAMHRNGVIPRPMIQQILGAITVPDPPARLLDSLTTEPLHDPDTQPESITISQQPLDVDLSTKLWSALQSPMRPCALYIATTVFLDPGETFPAARSVDEAVVSVQPAVRPEKERDVIVIKEPVP